MKSGQFIALAVAVAGDTPAGGPGDALEDVVPSRYRRSGRTWAAGDGRETCPRSPWAEAQQVGAKVFFVDEANFRADADPVSGYGAYSAGQMGAQG